MNSTHDIKDFLEHEAYEIRLSSLLMTTRAGSGHLTSCLSAADIMSALFFYGMKYDPDNYANPNNDRFILSKGHAAPVLYATWKEVGQLSAQELLTYRQIDSVLEGHPTLRFEHTEAATGALGIGLSIGVGMALSAKMDQRDFHTYVLLGDGELAEGCIWEAAEIAAHYKLDNLVAIVDANRLGQSTESLHNHHMHRYEEKFHAFGWKTEVIDGHDMNQVMHALDRAREEDELPYVIIAKTFKGHGINLVEDKEGFHGKALKAEQLSEAEESLKETFPLAVTYEGQYQWKPNIPENGKLEPTGCIGAESKNSTFKLGEEVATRQAYGVALTALGRICKDVISLDAEVKNSTFAEVFEERFPERFIQCFIAEQNMVSMGVGLDRRGKVPYISTFAAFFSRAFDQVRMAAISNARLRLVGSHAGVSIGQDGPSQMGLEDIALMCALPDSCVLYPSDAVSTYALVEQMAEYTQGISYLRTTRMKTSVIYKNVDDFRIGGCKVVKQSNNDSVLVIGAGVTLHEAIKAHDMLAQEDISIAVIDLYSIKPLDEKTILSVAKAAGKKIITVEDHYLQGGIGQTVAFSLRNTAIYIDSLAVEHLPRSGKPEELLAWAGIDAAAIVKKVKQLLQKG